MHSMVSCHIIMSSFFSTTRYCTLPRQRGNLRFGQRKPRSCLRSRPLGTSSWLWENLTNHTRPEHTVESPRYTQFWSHVSLFLVWTRVQVVNNRMATPLIQTFNHDQSNAYSAPGRPILPCTGRKATNLLVCVSLGQLAQTYSGEFRYRKFGFQNTELYRHYVRFDCSIAHSKALGDWNCIVPVSIFR